MSDFFLDRVGSIFFSIAFALFVWAVLNRQRVLMVLSLGRKKSFTRFPIMTIKIPGIRGALCVRVLILRTLLRKL
jgi:hypothetical protein